MPDRICNCETPKPGREDDGTFWCHDCGREIDSRHRADLLIAAHVSAAVRTEVEAMAEGIAQRVAELLRDERADGQLLDAAAIQSPR